jgi:hypothetical protein
MFYLPLVAMPRVFSRAVCAVFSRPVCAVEGAIRDYVVEAAEHSRERSLPAEHRPPPSSEEGRPFESVNDSSYDRWRVRPHVSAYLTLWASP